MASFEGPPIFTVTYYDRDWETIEDLLLEDVTFFEVQDAVATWLAYRLGRHMGSYDLNHPLKKVQGLVIGGYDGEA